ncbi:hypothetical protein J41TS12_13430 [Paenibacillus antibioticophila]|uniref:DUF2281 domain-containing protein n=2 Tax=Paenibacillus TaxID=44249 RepID=A0A919XNV5_9BACL|nr:DUF2281 domain-containing protein [Paenibacillus brevis]MBU5671136.1 DUF2281 domain-containing protein [Paenibacillus brevis]GIO36482.1 hypothetical protein J41TS12_13430 [Paenibacillus antibioticophila]
MSVNREDLKELIDGIHDQDAEEVYDFIKYLQMKREQKELKELERISETSMDFWNNPVDDEVWNEV